MQSSKSNLIFLHIPKCGGSTFHEILKREYRNEKIYSIDFKNGKLTTNDFLNLRQSERDKIKLLRGHMHFGLHNYFQKSFQYVTFLRNPIDRVISYYKYARKYKNHELHSFAISRSLSEFAIDINPYINNAALFHLSGLPIQTSPEIMFDKALENCKKFFPVIGILEKFDESLIRMQKEFGWDLPYYKKYNSTRKMNLKINSADIEVVEKLNQEEIKFYNIFLQNHIDEASKKSILNQKDFLLLKSKSKLYSFAKNVHDKIR